MELTTTRLVLRELRLDDAEAANRYERDPDVVRYTSHGTLTVEESRARIERSVAAAAEAPRRAFDFAVTLDGAFIGRVGFGVQDAESKQAMLWWILDPAHQGRGYATEAVARVTDLAFELGMHRVYADIDPRNGASLRVAEKLGMRREAHLRENLWLKDEWVDSVLYAVLDREWRARRG